jgi:hypothetical protein
MDRDEEGRDHGQDQDQDLDVPELGSILIAVEPMGVFRHARSPLFNPHLMVCENIL